VVQRCRRSAGEEVTCRGADAEKQRWCRGAEVVQMCIIGGTGAKVQRLSRCTASEMQERCRGAGAGAVVVQEQRCRGAEVVQWWCSGAEVQRCRWGALVVHWWRRCRGAEERRVRPAER